MPKALAHGTFQDQSRAVAFVEADCDAMAVAEIEFRQIAVQVLFGAVLINALHAALEDPIVAFDRVGMGDSADILIGAVVDGRMRADRAFLPRMWRGHSRFIRRRSP